MTFLDYEAVPYEPLCDPAGKLLSEALLLQSARGAGGALVRALRAALQAALGPGKVVYGIKERGGQRFWEFYFYLHAGPRLDWPSVRAALRGTLDLRWDAPALPEHFMWSFEVDAGTSAARGVSEFHVYRGTERDRRRFGESFVVRPGETRKENDYRFFVPASDGALLERELAGIPALGPQGRLAPLPVAPEQCGRVCLAHKGGGGPLPARANSLYFAGVPLAGFLGFLEAAGTYPSLLAWAKANSGRLDHLRYDMGFDFEAGAGGPRWLKSGVYGVL